MRLGRQHLMLIVVVAVVVFCLHLPRVWFGDKAQDRLLLYSSAFQRCFCKLRAFDLFEILESIWQKASQARLWKTAAYKG